ncbi:sarcosine oxidase subunit gamma [Sphingomonas sp. Tas61C01]|uniref:sarcosine oxidase subunit gamma n=1 Tax=Sphingomonas sp. Tas61C01 TaxID=3458297 RepID=UPI00403ED4FD
MSEPILSFGATRLRRPPADTQLLLHGDPGDRAALANCCGVELTDVTLTSAKTGGWSSLHLSPDEWLLVGPAGTGTDVISRLGAAPVAYSLVDISDRSSTLDLSGPGATGLLAGGCPLDLDAVPDGGCTRTLFGKVTILLWRRGDDWRISHARSYDDYIIDLLRAVADDLVEN